MRLLQVLLCCSLVQGSLGILYSNTTTSQSPTALASTSSSKIGGYLLVPSSVAKSDVLRNTTDSTGQGSSTPSGNTTITGPSTTISANLSTITAAPISPCGGSFTFNASYGGVSWRLNCPQANGTWDQEIPENTCSACSTGRSISGSWTSATYPLWVWTSECYVYPGTVSLFYWPTGTPNATYASTIYNEALGVTFTSPSIYYVLNTISASNACGAVGPTAKNAVFAYDLEDVTTWSRTAAGETTAGYGRLKLNDLAENCATTEPTDAEASAYMVNDVDRCNPRLQWPLNFKRFGYPYWKHCGAHGNKFGVYDPPIALTQAAAVVVPTMPSPPSSKSSAPSTGASRAANLPLLTSTVSRAAKSTAMADKAFGSATPSQASGAATSTKGEKAVDASVKTSAPMQSSTFAGIAEIIANVIFAAKVLTPASSSPLDVTTAQHDVLPIGASAHAIEDNEPEGTLDSPAGNMAPSLSMQQNDPVSDYETGRLDDSETVGLPNTKDGIDVPTNANSSPVQGPVPSNSFASTSGPLPSPTEYVLVIDGEGFNVVADASNVALFGSASTASVVEGVLSVINGHAIEPSENGNRLLMDGSVADIHSPTASVDESEDDDDERIVVTFAKGGSLMAAPGNGAMLLEAPSSTITLNADEMVSVAGQAVDTVSSVVIMVDSATKLFATPSSVRDGVAEAIVTMYDQTFTAVATDGAVVLEDAGTTTTLRHGDDSATFAGKHVEAVSGALSVGTKTISLTAKPSATPAATMTDSEGQEYTVIQSGSAILFQAAGTTATLHSGENTTFAGQDVRIHSDGIVVGTLTIHPAATTTPNHAMAVFTDVTGQTWTAMSASNSFILTGPSTTITLCAGQTATLAGETLMAQGNQLVVGSSAVSFAFSITSTSSRTAFLTSSNTVRYSATSLPGQTQGTTSTGDNMNSGVRISPARLWVLLPSMLCGVILLWAGV